MATDFSLPVFVPTTVTVAGTPYLLPVFQTGKVVKVKNIATTTEYTGVEEGASGIYKFTNIPNGKYHKLIDGVQSGTFGVTNGRYIADDLLPYAKLAGGNTFSGNQTFQNDVQIDGPLNVALYATALELFINALSPAYTGNTPSFNNSLVWKSWVESQIASIVVTPYQESSNLVRCIPNGTQEANKVYRTPKLCAASFASPSATNQCAVLVSGMGAALQYLNLDLNTLRNYVHFLGTGKHCKIIMRDGSSNTKTMNWKNLTIIFGALDFGVDREYSSMTFEDCDIYAYRNTTFNNCNLIRCRIFHASTYKAFLKGSTTAEMCGFLNDPDKSLLSDPATAVGSYKLFLPGGMPLDPSTPEIPA